MSIIPLGATPVLDHGWVKLLSCSPSGRELQVIRAQYYRGITHPSIISMTQIAIEIKMPIFVRLAIGRIPFVSKPSDRYEDFYTPTVADISSGNLEDDTTIQENIQMTLEALHVNQDTYASDGCNQFVAKMTVPICSYVTGIAYGTIGDWLDFTSAVGAPPQVKAYQTCIKNMLTAEFPFWDEMERRRNK